MVTLISRWKVRPDITDSEWTTMVESLRSLANIVEAAEEQTLVYRVHTTVPDPRVETSDAEKAGYSENATDSENASNSAKANVTEDRAFVTFYEVYESEHAFQIHLHGEPFNQFLRQSLKYFELSPDREGFPLTDTTFLHLESGFVRAQLDQK